MAWILTEVLGLYQHVCLHSPWVKLQDEAKWRNKIKYLIWNISVLTKTCESFKSNQSIACGLLSQQHPLLTLLHLSGLTSVSDEPCLYYGSYSKLFFGLGSWSKRSVCNALGHHRRKVWPLLMELLIIPLPGFYIPKK